MKIQKPTKGRVVMYVSTTDTQTALITGVGEQGKIDLVAFPRGASPTVWNDVTHSAPGQVQHTWHYPPFVKEEIEVAE